MPAKFPYQPLPPLFVAAIAGIMVDRYLAFPVFFWALLCFGSLVIWFVLASFGNKTKTRKRGEVTNTTQVGNTESPLPLIVSNASNSSYPYPLIFLAFAAFFGLWHHAHWYRFSNDDIGCYAPEYRLNGGPAAIMGTVAEMPKFYPKPPTQPGQIFDSSEKTVFTLRAEQLRDGSHWVSVSGKVLVTVYADCREFRIGDQLQLFGELVQPPKPNNYGDFDYNDYLRGHRTLALLRCPNNTAVTRLSSHRYSVSRLLESVRRTGLSNLEKHLSPQTLSIAEAMIFGVRESVDHETQQNMIDTGTFHALSISGLHVVLIAGIAAWFLRQMQFSRRVTAMSMIVFVLFYLLLTDVRPPAIRATALTCSVAIAFYVSRPLSAQNVLCASALIVLFINPSELFQVGAQLSFIATGSFLWVPSYRHLKSAFYPSTPTDADLHTLQDIERVETTTWRWLRQVGKVFQRCVEVFLFSLIIWLFSMPLLLSNIHLFTPVAILVNPLLWIPLAAAMFFGFLTALLGQVPLIGTIFGIGADWSFYLMLEMIAWFQQLGGHYWVPGPPDWWNLGFYAVFAFYTFLPVQRPRWWILLTALIVWILIGIGAGYYRDFERLRNDRLTLTVLSIGHGNSVLITTPEKRTIICDTGNLTNPRYVADTMSRSLWRNGKTHIDAILISHPDNDHFNGVPLLMERFSIGVVLISPYFGEVAAESPWGQLKTKLEAHNIPIQIIGDGDDLSEYGLLHATILHPPKENFEEWSNSNATSLVLRLEHRGVGIILPGDLDGREPSPFLLREPIPTEIVMVPHHGGRSLQTASLLEWATPKTLIYSTGKLTHNPEVLEQFRQKGYEVRSTLLEGAIEINVGK